jgi:hypothetical protein
MKTAENSPVQEKKMSKSGARIIGASLVSIASVKAIAATLNLFTESPHHTTINKRSSVNSGTAATENE